MTNPVACLACTSEADRARLLAAADAVRTATDFDAAWSAYEFVVADLQRQHEQARCTAFYAVALRAERTPA